MSRLICVTFWARAVRRPDLPRPQAAAFVVVSCAALSHADYVVGGSFFSTSKTHNNATFYRFDFLRKEARQRFKR